MSYRTAGIVIGIFTGFFSAMTGVGGGGDVTARLIAPGMSRLLGQQVVVDNREAHSEIIPVLAPLPRACRNLGRDPVAMHGTGLASLRRHSEREPRGVERITRSTDPRPQRQDPTHYPGALPETGDEGAIGGIHERAWEARRTRAYSGRTNG